MMVLTPNDVEEALSHAYLQAVAARAGFIYEPAGRNLDNMGVDAKLIARVKSADGVTYTEVEIWLQLKATTRDPIPKDGRYRFWLQGVKRYNDLRKTQSGSPRLLVVLFLPGDENAWLEHSEEQLISRRCAYWVSLKGAPETDNESGVTVYLPRENVLSVDGLKRIAARLASGEELSYG